MTSKLIVVGKHITLHNSMDRKKLKVCELCQQCNETVFYGICETCEPIWLDQIGTLSKQLDGKTTLVELFDKVAKNAKTKLQGVHQK